MHVYKCWFLKVLFSAKFHWPLYWGHVTTVHRGGRSDHQHSSPGPSEQWAVSPSPLPPPETQEMLSTEGPHHINIASCCLAQYDLTTFQLHQRIKWLNTTTSEFWFSSFCCWKWLPSHNNMNSGPILARAREQRDYRADVCCVLLLLMTTAQHQMTTASTRLVFISDISRSSSPIQLLLLLLRLLLSGFCAAVPLCASAGAVITIIITTTGSSASCRYCKDGIYIYRCYRYLYLI